MWIFFSESPKNHNAAKCQPYFFLVVGRWAVLPRNGNRHQPFEWKAPFLGDLVMFETCESLVMNYMKDWLSDKVSKIKKNIYAFYI